VLPDALVRTSPRTLPNPKLTVEYVTVESNGAKLKGPSVRNVFAIGPYVRASWAKLARAERAPTPSAQYLFRFAWLPSGEYLDRSTF
jgi:hypothetical protein